ncbi:MAG: PAS domain S-box protein [candidate division Zixibacteria bacterium]|nr:PAS domain S-box protein [candidate division Zixibacteria bacterium]
MRLVSATKEPVTIEREFRDSDGNTHTYEVYASPILAENGSVELVVFQQLDITERKLADNLLRQQTADLTQRVKEQQCLYSLTQLLQDSSASPDIILNQAVELSPSGMQYPEITTACIVVLSDAEYTAAAFSTSDWRLSAPIRVGGESVP